MRKKPWRRRKPTKRIDKSMLACTKETNLMRYIRQDEINSYVDLIVHCINSKLCKIESHYGDLGIYAGPLRKEEFP